MPEINLGDLAQTKLFDILKPLFSGKKTGKITVKGKEGGELYLELGNVIHAKTASAIGEYAFFFLMGLKVGKALFEPDGVPSERTISISTEQLLLNWSYRKQEWDKLKEVIPSTNAVFRLSLQKSAENKNINADQWNVLALCNGTKTISEIAESLSWDEFKTSKIIFQLVQLALLEKVEEQKPVKKNPVSEGFLSTVEMELKKMIGPLAPLIISDKLSDLGETKESLDQGQALFFVEKLGEEISNATKKKEFLQIMTDFSPVRKRELNPAVFPGLISNCKSEDLPTQRLWVIARKTRVSRGSVFSRSLIGVRDVKSRKKGKAMIFPKGEVRHQNLLTAYTDVSAFLSALKSEGFSGILEIEFPEKRGTIFIDSGEVLSAEIKEKGDAERTIGKEGIQAFLTSMNQKNGVLNVYRWLPEQVALITSHLQHEVLFKELSTDYTRLDRLLLKLKEDKHDGFIEVLTKEKKAFGVLFVEGGEPVEMFTLPESGPSVFGRKFIPAFLENVSKQGGVMLNVYKSRSTVPRKEEPIPGSKPPSEGKPILESKPLATDRDGLQEVIPILQETLSGAERLVDAASRNGIFVGAFKKCLIEKAETFSFLDPFAGEFEYQDGVIRFSGAVGEKEFTRGVLECLNTTIILLEKELPKNKMLSLKLGVQIKSSLEHHSDTLKRLGLTEVVSSSLR